MNKRQRSSTVTIVILTWVMCLCLIAGDALAGKVALDKGTKIEVRFDLGAKISSRTSAVGDTVNISLADPIIIGGQVIVEEGAPGKAVVTEVENNGRVGKPGLITVDFVSLESKGSFKLPEGEVIPLLGAVTDKGKGKKLLSLILGFGLLIKGGQGEIDTGQAYPATIDQAVILEN